MQRLEIIRTYTTPESDPKAKPEPLYPGVEEGIVKALTTLEKDQGFVVSGHSADGLALAVKKLATTAKIRIAIKTVPTEYGGEAVRVWIKGAAPKSKPPAKRKAAAKKAPRTKAKEADNVHES